MKTLSSLHLVQYSFWEYETFNLRAGGTAFLGPNGAGKTSVVDAIQVALVGGHGNHMHFNTQSVHKDHRSVRDYALGMMRSGTGDRGVISRKRDEALSYITMVFEGDNPEDCVSAGICIHSLVTESSHRTLGLYILPGVKLKLDDHLGALGDEDKAPLDWQTFDALVRRLSKQAGRTPTITTKPETYLDELLHALQHKGRTIDRAKFLRALAQSLKLKDITSVNDYLRGYLVDAQPIDKQGTLKHIRTVRELVRQIEEIKKQIVQLNDIDTKFNLVANLYRTRSIADAVRLQLQMENEDNKVAYLNQSIYELESEIGELDTSLEAMAGTEKAHEAISQELFLEYNANPASKAPEETRKLRTAYQATLDEKNKAVARLILDVRDALGAVAELLKQCEKEEADIIRKLSRAWDDQAAAGKYPSLLELKEVLGILASSKETILDAHKKNSESHQEAESKLKAAIEKVKAADQGMRILDEDVAIAMALFSENGIESRTVASLVKVKDIRWQPAIESFLGKNRSAIVVKPGLENDAVRLLRKLNIPLYDVTVVQPAHLKNDMGREVDLQSVAALLNSEDPVALTYLRRILGRMRQVQTEDELRDHDRALTVDGMLSANGGTRRIKLISPERWALGVQVSNADKELLREGVIVANTDVEKTKKLFDLSKDADEKLRRALKNITLEQYNLALSEFDSAKAKLSTTEEIDDAALPDYLLKLKERVAAAKQAAEDAKSERMTAFERSVKKKQELDIKKEALEHASTALKRIQNLHLNACNDIDYDSERAVMMYERALSLAETDRPEVALQYLVNEQDTANKRLISAESSARSEFTSYINEMSINLVDERSDWRKASTWVKSHVQKLTSSTLADYQNEAETARDAANQSFRADVAYRMREAIKRVEHDINDLNKVLEDCPEFTGGEKYKFVAKPALAYKGLYDLILSSAFVDTGTAPLFEAADDVQRTLLNFLDACETGEGKANNPLEDYRLLFNFDLEIWVGGKPADTLSKRLGVGSNGEHLVPFYVIAGASLANAYRLKSNEPYDGAPLMLIDEAFHGFDALNTFVTAKFLQSLGLQLLMAAPDADVGKLTPILDSYYDLDRYGADVFFEETVIKEKAKKLMESDMPERNPALVEKMVEQLSLQ
ncbi:SbcC/MukB-like Walker B domain-containing protein [Candidatus Ferrigenium straubiae]|jgi:hypothetical protein|uniref:SbcC/MukB-like Walker B domain-containing protein n=1 Tax=Candidatus Ferrigenium straubiae TaxID=2919506 RepID=UPI003F4AF3BF